MSSSSLWVSSEPVTAGSGALAALPGLFWSVRIRASSSWVWDVLPAPLSLPSLLSLLPRSLGVPLRLWCPSVELGSVLLDRTSPRRQTLLSLSPFPSRELAGLHEECFALSSSLLASHGAADLLGVPARRRLPQFRDPGYWLAGVELPLARASLALARSRMVPLESAQEALLLAGFASLPPDVAEVVAALSGEWVRSLPELFEAARLVL